MPDEPKGLNETMVGGRFWLARAAEAVISGLRGRETAAQHLQSTITWFWTAYTASALVGASLSRSAIPAWLTGLLATPPVLLIIAYALAAWALMPVTVTFDPRVPEEIERAHMGAVKSKQRRLLAAQLMTGLACVAVVMAIAATLTSQAQEERFHAVLHRSEAGTQLLVRGDFPRGSEVTLSVTPMVRQQDRAPVPAMERLEVASGRGEVRATVDVPEADAWRVQARWRQEQTEWSASRTLKRGD